MQYNSVTVFVFWFFWGFWFFWVFWFFFGSFGLLVSWLSGVFSFSGFLLFSGRSPTLRRLTRRQQLQQLRLHPHPCWPERQQAVGEADQPAGSGGSSSPG